MNAINVDHAMRFVERYEEVSAERRKSGLGAIYFNARMLRYLMEKLPVIEAEPLRHGRWLQTDNGDTCSVCEHGIIAHFANVDLPIQLSMSNYCPNCGAKMDLEEG